MPDSIQTDRLHCMTPAVVHAIMAGQSVDPSLAADQTTGMPLRIECPAGHKLIVPEDRAGRTLRCPRCDAAFVVPGERRQETVVSRQESGASVQTAVCLAEQRVSHLDLPAREQSSPV